jgi:hypothetical protein
MSERQVRRPELVAKRDQSRYLEAMLYATVARQLLNYHAALARASSDVASLLRMTKCDCRINHPRRFAGVDVTPKLPLA